MGYSSTGTGPTRRLLGGDNRTRPSSGTARCWCAAPGGWPIARRRSPLRRTPCIAWDRRANNSPPSWCCDSPAAGDSESHRVHRPRRDVHRNRASGARSRGAIPHACPRRALSCVCAARRPVRAWGRAPHASAIVTNTWLNCDRVRRPPASGATERRVMTWIRCTPISQFYVGSAHGLVFLPDANHSWDGGSLP